jgi:hypothetical protein
VPSSMPSSFPSSIPSTVPSSIPSTYPSSLSHPYYQLDTTNTSTDDSELVSLSYDLNFLGHTYSPYFDTILQGYSITFYNTVQAYSSSVSYDERIFEDYMIVQSSCVISMNWPSRITPPFLDYSPTKQFSSFNDFLLYYRWLKRLPHTIMVVCHSLFISGDGKVAAQFTRLVTGGVTW